MSTARRRSSAQTSSDWLRSSATTTPRTSSDTTQTSSPDRSHHGELAAIERRLLEPIHNALLPIHNALLPTNLRCADLLDPVQWQGVHGAPLNADCGRGHTECVEDRFFGCFRAGFEEGGHVVVGDHAAGRDQGSPAFSRGKTVV